MQALKITAYLLHGIAHASPWTISLDGLLASCLWRRNPSPDPLADPSPPDLDLPLARCFRNGRWWHWAATCGWPNNAPDEPEIHWWHSELDHRHAEQVAAELPQRISAQKGRWKTWHMPLPVTICSSLSWHAWGDADLIGDLLADVVSIGKKRSQGEGRVTSWSIEPANVTLYEAGHLSPTGALARPCPPECLIDPTTPHGGLGYAAIRPPHMHHSRRTDAYLPA